MISPQLLEILACPSCREQLRHEERENRLVCVGCGRAYRIDDGLPLLLVDDIPAIDSSEGGVSERE